MRHLFSVVMKFVLTTFLLFIVLGGFYDASFADIVLVSFMLSALGYIGDVFILPRVGNTVATIGDFGLAFIVLWFMGYYLFDWDVPILSSALIGSTLIAAGEWFFHKHMKNTFMDREAVS